MQLAISDTGQKIKASPNGRAICPNCKSMVIAKCGDLNIWHWAHDNFENCDTWTYESKTEWHLKWQRYFNEDETEVYINKYSQHHVADIFTKAGLVIEIQNSPISTTEIFERETFYDKMVWLVNSKEFKHNLRLKEFSYDIGKEIWFRWITPYPPEDERGFAIVIPLDDHFGQIEPALISCKYKKSFDEHNKTEFWYNKKTQFEQPVDKDLLSAFSSYLLDTKMVYILDENRNYSTNFKWLHLRKTWVETTKPIFIDLNNDFLFYIKTLHKNGNGFGKVVSKNTFLKKYRI